MLTYTINENKQFNSLEISFNEKPSAAILNNLKALKMRWNPKRSIWYGFTTAEQVENAINGKIEIIKPIKEIKNCTKLTEQEQQDRSEAVKIAASNWGDPEHWAKYYNDKIAYAVKLDNGDYLTIDKPTIETRFCFGYGMYGISSEEESAAAYNRMKDCDTKPDHFIKENTKKLKRYIELLEIMKANYNDEIKLHEALNNYNYDYTTCRACYYSGHKVKELDFCRYYNGAIYDHWNNPIDSYILLSYGEITRVLDGYKKVMAQLEKRINTYLKKYGTSKLTTWTYLRD